MAAKAPLSAPVDLDLDVLAPDSRTFVFRGKTYSVPGDISVPTLVEAMKLRGRMLALDADGDEEAKSETVEALYVLVMDIVKDANEDVSELRLSITQLMYLLGLILSGEEGVTPEEALAAEIAPQAPEKAAEDSEHPPTSRKKKAA